MLRLFKGILLVTFLCLTLSTPSFASEDNSTIFTLNQQDYKVNGQSGVMDCTPILYNDKVYVPLRFLANGCGINNDNIKWDDEKQTIELSSGVIKLSLQVGNKILVKNNEIKNIDVAPIFQDNRVFLPARLVAEELGYEVIWNESNKTITIQPDTSVDRQQLELTMKSFLDADQKENVEEYMSYIDKKSTRFSNSIKANKIKQFKEYDINLEVSNIKVNKIEENKAEVQYDIIAKKVKGDDKFKNSKSTILCYFNKYDDDNLWKIDHFKTLSVKYLN